MPQNYLALLGDRDEAKTRYYKLKELAQGEAAASAPVLPGNPATIADDLVVLKDTLPGGSYWHGTIRKGRTLRIVNTGATPGVSLQIYNRYDTTERFCAGDTVKVQWSANLGKGKVLLSAMGRSLATITDDTCGAHDAIVGHSTAQSNEAQYGSDTYYRNSHDAFLLAANKYGLGVRDIAPSLSLFAPVGTDGEGRFLWEGDRLAAGQYVDLRADMHLIVVVSNCPHPLAPGSVYDPQPVEIVVWDAPNEDLPATSEEAQRAYENTSDYLALEEM